MHIAKRSAPAVIKGHQQSPAELTPPPSVLDVLNRGVVERRMLFPDNAPAREVVRWEAPQVESGEDLEDIQAYLGALEALLHPAARGELLARILALLSHYRSDSHPPEVEMRIADDWAEDLGEYPMWAIESAARAWRRTRKFKPQICEMIALCAAVVSDRLAERDRLRSVVDRARFEGSRYGGQIAGLARGMLRRVPR